MPLEMTDNRRAQELHDTLTVAVKQIDDDLKSTVEAAKAKAQADMAPLRDSVDDYYIELMAGATKQFQITELAASKERSDKAFAKVGTLEDLDLSAVSQVNGEVENALYWVVAKPVDQKAIDETVGRDRAKEAEEKAAKLKG